MKISIPTTVVVALFTLSTARGTLFTESFNNINLTIPDGNPVGALSSGTVSDIGNNYNIVDVAVSFSISGGYNANLYAYLVSPNGTMVTLLDHPGVTPENPFGNAGSGMSIRLADGGAGITDSSDLSSGTYAAVGSFAAFGGGPAAGTWRLYFADMVSGGGVSMLDNWSLEITAVPEPVTYALPVFGVIVGLVSLAATHRRKNATTTQESFKIE